ncbi:MAG TPA: MOSC domain-containing protein [Thermoanaerobaculia bacterium]|nr:MOSC domain-containing protein [Thermoanaerobaculia bacterium]
MGEIVQIWIKRFKRGPMDPVGEAQLVEGGGLTGSANQGGRRQVTIIDEAAWKDATIELGFDVDPSARRANVMLRGVDLRESRGRLLELGNCIVRIIGETRPCDQMDDAQPGLRNALGTAWRGGAYGEIVRGGRIRLGDEARFVVAAEFNRDGAGHGL